MKQMVVMVIFVCIAFLPMIQTVDAGETVEVVMPVRGMFCSSCAANVEKALKELDGVADARVELSRDRVRVRYLPDRVTLRRMEEALRKWGYELQFPRREERRNVP